MTTGGGITVRYTLPTGVGMRSAASRSFQGTVTIRFPARGPAYRVQPTPHGTLLITCGACAESAEWTADPAQPTPFIVHTCAAFANGVPDLVMPFGKHKGVRASQLPIDYLSWLLKSDIKGDALRASWQAAWDARWAQAKAGGGIQALATPLPAPEPVAPRTAGDRFFEPEE